MTKTKIRPLHILYEEALKQYLEWIEDFGDVAYCGICKVIFYNKSFSEAEREMLNEHFQSQKPSPTVNAEFYEDITYKNGNERWWWKEKIDFGGEVDYYSGNQQRVWFLKKMIRITKPWYIKFYEFLKEL